MHKKILIVDDYESICNSLAMLFREDGYLVDNTSDSSEAALLIKKNRYDACVFDYKMKPLTGIDLLKMVKNKDPGCSVFIISGVLTIELISADKSVVSLATGLITKPFDAEELLKKIAAVLL
jgi:DNA-binding NtrC family response regulator